MLFIWEPTLLPTNFFNLQSHKLLWTPYQAKCTKVRDRTISSELWQALSEAKACILQFSIIDSSKCAIFAH
jgi:hypothetical protein